MNGPMTAKQSEQLGAKRARQSRDLSAETLTALQEEREHTWAALSPDEQAMLVERRRTVLPAGNGADSSRPEPNALDHAEVDHWLDEKRIVRVVNSYFRALDEKHFDESYFGQLLSTDAKMIRPNGAVTVGPANIAQGHARSFDRFEASQHLLTGHDVDIDGDAATVRANLVAVHLWNDRPVDASMLERSFTAGGIITAALIRLADGWRITYLGNQVIWRTGFPGNLLQTQ